MTTIQADAVTEVLKKAVAEKGEDYVYPYYATQCMYADPEDPAEPSCIVGHVIAALDPKAFERIAEVEQENGESFGVGSLVTDGYATLESDRLQDALNAAQLIQDTGRPWKYALEAYERVLAGENEYDVGRDIRDRIPVAPEA